MRTLLKALLLAVPVALGAQRDGSHDFDFLIGNWKAHVRALPDRLVGSTKWLEYDGISNRMYNPTTHQWSICLLDLDKGELDTQGRAIFVRYVWLNVSPTSTRFEQSWSVDGGKTWEVNFTADLTRAEAQ